ncbi:glutaminase A, partial [Bacillus nitratireducens]|nr:glutaminase A [Bacillus nitratireducens]
MHSIRTNNLEQLLKQVQSYTKKDKLATYNPELRNAKPENLGIAIYNKETNNIHAVHTQTLFTL